MEEKERQSVQDAVSAAARLALWLVGELEPNSNAVLEQDLDDVYSLLIAVERRARREGRLVD